MADCEWCPPVGDGDDATLNRVHEIGALRTRTRALAAEHDRLYRELERLGRLADQQKAELLSLRRFARLYYQVCKIRTWTNEDGKRFVFADDLAAALEVPCASTGEAPS